MHHDHSLPCQPKLKISTAHPFEILLNTAPELIKALTYESPNRSSSSIIHQNINGCQLFDFPHRLDALIVFCNIAAIQVHFSSFCFTQLSRFFLSLDIEIEEGECSSCFRETKGNVSPNSSTGTRYNDELPLEVALEVVRVNGGVNLGIQSWLNHGEAGIRALIGTQF